jgi:hypothetical protein
MNQAEKLVAEFKAAASDSPQQKVTVEEIYHWAGDAATYTESLLALLAEIANGEYEVAQFVKDVRSYTDDNK